MSDTQPRTTPVDAPFPHSAFININHLGLSKKKRFNAKQSLIKMLARRNDFVAVEELHVSPARAQESFFDHVGSHVVLYNSHGNAPGQCIMINKSFSKQLGFELTVEALTHNHQIFIQNVAHAFWWIEGNTCKMILNTYLSAHDNHIRQQQIEEITRQFKSFKQQCTNCEHFVIIAGGNRNFVINQSQHQVSSGSSWYPGAGLLNAWSAYLEELGVKIDTELEEPTFKRFSKVEGRREWVCRTLDYGAAGIDPIKYANWQVAVRARMDHARASDHKAIELTFEKRPNRAQRAQRRSPQFENVIRPIPEWLFDEPRFKNIWEASLKEWQQDRQLGLHGLGEFVNITRQIALKFFREQVIEATCDRHRFEICMRMQIDACNAEPLAMKTLARRLQIYPRLRQLFEIEVNVANSTVLVRSTPELESHINELIANITNDEENDEQVIHNAGVSDGVTLKGSTRYSTCVQEIKERMLCKRYKIVELWDESRGVMERDPEKMASLIRNAGVMRSGLKAKKTGATPFCSTVI